ncbi:UDP-N-acetylmuramate--L-alanine ligase [Oenococcus oeni]|uniref:UDP-N-acetylmuramate--L-alanine ligase n=1 Tax=Oenococcus oeni TaxID=1247 RepID=UPI00050DA8A4|nr:UDP-N-acetylmuramate--L-alanine ligase [Oenococcus oeni]KGI01604.1 UDP-N-acetylmuramate--alanine ligase [Oenococcus oeni IOEB_C52]
MTNYYFIGIKGTGMASLALILHDQGNKVLGSDIDKETFTQFPLVKAGIQITDFDPDLIKSNYVVVKGNAFSDDHPQVLAAKKVGAKLLTYPQAVEEVIRRHFSIAVSGAHGKTSTTSLLAHILSNFESTSYLIGDGVGKGVFSSKYFVVEADEYERHFQPFTPDVAIITNIDWDHPDYYKSLDDVKSAFSEFADHVKKIIFAYGEDPEIKKIKPKTARILSYGFEKSDYFCANNIDKRTEGSYFSLSKGGRKLGDFFATIEGDHGILDTTAAIAVADYLGFSVDQIQKGLLTYQGAKRRFNISQVADLTIVDDYAHHPTEIKATIDAARQKFPNKRLVAVFQPHTYTRVNAFKDEYVDALKSADKVYITPIFGSLREKAGNAKSEDILDKLPNAGTIISESNAYDKLSVEHGSVLVFMGAGDIEKYEDALKKGFE